MPEKSDLLIEDLGEGLILRHASIEDTPALVEFNSRIHSDAGPDIPDIYVGAWTADLLSGGHPTFRAADFTIVEDTATGKIVSSLNLISQTWTYEGIPFGVGRPELVGTDPAYRRKGLVRKQFDLIHRWSEARGELVQGITGIPYYYRQFGYEMAMNLGGSATGFFPHVPRLAEGETDPYTFRPARSEDLYFIKTLSEAAAQRSMVNAVRDDALWRYEIEGRSQMNCNRTVLYIIEDAAGNPQGFIGLPVIIWEPTMALIRYELTPGASWWQITPSVVRFLWATGQQMSERDNRRHEAFTFALGADHPAYKAFGHALPRHRDPYAWYLRVPDLPAFLGKIAPVFRQRLEHSVCPGYNGEVNLSFYHSGVNLRFENGECIEVKGWKGTPPETVTAFFPGLTFLQLLFGYRSIYELHKNFVDCYVDEERNYVLLDALFPAKPSSPWMID